MSNPTRLPGLVMGAQIGALGCDTTQPLYRADVRRLVKRGFTFCVRYVNLADNPVDLADNPDFQPLDIEEAQTILAGGLALMVVQAARTTLVTPRVAAADGSDDGESAARSCKGIGLPSGVNVWLHLQSIDGDVFRYAKSWHAAVSKAGYVPGIYVGANIKNQGRSVTGLELFTSFKSGHYWRSRSAVPNVEIRGYQMIQLFPQTKDLLDIKIDINVTQNDYKHDTVRWLRAPIG